MHSCGVCNKEFTAKPSANRIFCSQKYAHIGMDRNMSGWERNISGLEIGRTMFKGKKRPELSGVNNGMYGRTRAKDPERYEKISKSLQDNGNLKHDKNPNWKGGLSYLPYSIYFNKKLKKSIRESHDFKCNICKLSEEDIGHTLRIHHIDYDKQNSEAENLIPLCISCHSKTNFNREYWAITLIGGVL